VRTSVYCPNSSLSFVIFKSRIPALYKTTVPVQSRMIFANTLKIRVGRGVVSIDLLVSMHRRYRRIFAPSREEP
jgi:hypothetical protein